MTAPLSSSTTIDAGSDIFTLINTFQVTPADQDALASELAFVTEGVMRFLPGFIAASVHKSLDGNYVVNYVQWKTRHDFDAMFAHPDVKKHLDKVKALATSVTPVFYAVAYVGAQRALSASSE
jgi:heme-degrading monooxygenase HmoA